jgi:hypothetical protein
MLSGRRSFIVHLVKGPWRHCSGVVGGRRTTNGSRKTP